MILDFIRPGADGTINPEAVSLAKPAKLMIEILLAAVQAIVNPAKVEELDLTPKTGFASVVKVVLEGVITRKGRK